MSIYSAVQIHVVKGSVSAVIVHTTFDHVYLDSRVHYVLCDSASCFFVSVQIENLDVERQGDRGQPPLVHHGRRVVLVLRLEPEVLQEAREKEEYLGPGECSSVPFRISICVSSL